MTYALSHYLSASSIPSITTEIHTESQICEEIPSLLKWPPVNNDCIVPILTGITNKIFKLSHPNEPSKSVIVRIYGGADVFTPEQRAAETFIYGQLSDAQIAPPLMATFSNGRIEHFLNAHTPKLEQMTSSFVCRGVAIQLARLHSFNPSSKSPSLSTVPTTPIQPALWKNLNEWVDAIKKQLNEYNVHNNEQLMSENIDIHKCIEAVQIAQNSLEQDDIVFSHNDVHAGNTLVDNVTRNITLIDYEYCDYNYRAYDIGNFFCEAMGGIENGIVQPHLYPNIQFRTTFCTIYLKEFLGYDADIKDIEQLVEKAERFGLISHLYWGFWAIIQSRTSLVNFPYLKFASQRFNQFFNKFEMM